MYITYGMTYEQFWYGDPWMVRAYSQAYLLKRRIDNEIAWIHGAYVYNALNAAMTTAFSKKKANYIKAPVDFYPKTEAEKAEEKRQKKKELIRYLTSWTKKKKPGVDQNGEP